MCRVLSGCKISQKYNHFTEANDRVTLTLTFVEGPKNGKGKKKLYRRKSMMYNSTINHMMSFKKRLFFANVKKDVKQTGHILL